MQLQRVTIALHAGMKEAGNVLAAAGLQLRDVSGDHLAQTVKVRVCITVPGRNEFWTSEF